VIFYDWKKVLRLSNGNIKDIIRIMYANTYQLNSVKFKRNKEKFRLLTQDIKGDSYLLNPKEIFKNDKHATLKQMAEYISLASLRNYLDYKWYKNTTLPFKYTNINRQAIENNPLLEIDNNDNIHFTLEEIRENGN